MGKQINLNREWRFHLGDEPAADFMGYDDSAWRVVTLPHDWSVEHPFDRSNASGTGYLPGGTAWYRKHFTLPGDVQGKRVRITFGGVYKHARVYINSNHLGSNAYGYTTFTFDVSEFVRPGENVLSVRVEHEQVADSRWFTGSGIYRDVVCEISDMCCFKQNGIFVTTKEATAEQAIVHVAYETLGGDGAAFDVVDASGTVVASGKAEGECGTCNIAVEQPALWSVDAPHLYTLRAKVLSGGVVTDETALRFGIRTIRFDADTGFYLNGVNMKLKGFCVHHDAGCLGAAVPKAVWARRLRKLKALGANALRTSHNPPDSHLLDLCDELGLLVQDEAFDEWEGAKNKWWQGHNVYPPKRFGYAEDFPQWHQFDLESMVKRDRNHPCVIMWSIGNEIDYPNDPYVTPLFTEVLGNNDANKPKAERMYDDRKPDAGRLAVVAKQLVEIVHALDLTRPVTSALSFPELSTRTGYADALDASGYNYKEQFYAEDHARFPGRVIYGSENSHSGKAWQAVKDNDYICGQFLWTGVDFLGECLGWPVRISQAGLLDLAGNEKPLAYQRRAFWTDAPFVKISTEPGEGQKHHGVWHERFVWDGEAGDRMYVSVATNQPEAELFLNGVSLGKKAITLDTECRATWEVPYAAGELKAVAGAAVDTLRTPGKAAEIVLTPDKTVFAADGLDVIQVEVSLLDAEGRLTTKDEDIRYQLAGDAEILGIENGIPNDLTPYAEKHRATRQGRAIVYLRAGVLPGEVTLYAYTRSGLKAQVSLAQQ
ncbi:MAG: sugar-binding domain-containing protein [Aristaeellaceae bacterium]